MKSGKTSKPLRPRNPFVEAARRRGGGPMRDRRVGRGGAHNEERELLAEVEEEAGAESTEDVGGGDSRQAELPLARPEGFGRRVAISGNRGITDADREIIRARIRALVEEPGVAAILFGGALGADTEALAAALDAREETSRGPTLIVIVPDTLAAQPRETQATSGRADERIELGHPIRAEDRWRAYHLRNRRLVAEATELVAFWNGDERSGTSATIGLARKRGLPVEIVEVEGGD